MFEILGALATWRLTSLLHYEEGPFRVFDRLRQKLGVFEEAEGNLAGLFSCFWCLSVWIAAIPSLLLIILDIIALRFSLLESICIFALRVLGFSAFAILFDEGLK